VITRHPCNLTGLVVACVAAAAWLAPAGSASASGNPYVDAVLANNPIGYWRFNELAGGVIPNSASTGAIHDAMDQGTVTFGNPSYAANLGTSFGFNGAGAIRIPDHADFDLGTGDYAVELWFNTNTTNRGDLFTYKGGGGDFGIHSESQGANTVSVFFNGFDLMASNIPINSWHHVVVTRNSGTAQLYLDGALKATQLGNTDSLNIANDLLVGSNHNGNPDNLAIQFNGLIDEVAFYGHGLSDADVLAHFDASTTIAVPEPVSACLALFGLAATGVMTRRRRRA
jgi:Concanavalin A-like lectin/glucanases superfamily